MHRTLPRSLTRALRHAARKRREGFVGVGGPRIAARALATKAPKSDAAPLRGAAQSAGLVGSEAGDAFELRMAQRAATVAAQSSEGAAADAPASSKEGGRLQEQRRRQMEREMRHAIGYGQWLHAYQIARQAAKSGIALGDRTLGDLAVRCNESRRFRLTVELLKPLFEAAAASTNPVRPSWRCARLLAEAVEALRDRPTAITLSRVVLPRSLDMRRQSLLPPWGEDARDRGVLPADVAEMSVGAFLACDLPLLALGAAKLASGAVRTELVKEIGDFFMVNAADVDAAKVLYFEALNLNVAAQRGIEAGGGAESDVDECFVRECKIMRSVGVLAGTTGDLDIVVRAAAGDERTMDELRARWEDRAAIASGIHDQLTNRSGRRFSLASPRDSLSSAASRASLFASSKAAALTGLLTGIVVSRCRHGSFEEMEMLLDAARFRSDKSHLLRDMYRSAFGSRTNPERLMEFVDKMHRDGISMEWGLAFEAMTAQGKEANYEAVGQIFNLAASQDEDGSPTLEVVQTLLLTAGQAKNRELTKALVQHCTEAGILFVPRIVKAAVFAAGSVGHTSLLLGLLQRQRLIANARNPGALNSLEDLDRKPRLRSRVNSAITALANCGLEGEVRELLRRTASQNDGQLPETTLRTAIVALAQLDRAKVLDQLLRDVGDNRLGYMTAQDLDAAAGAVSRMGGVSALEELLHRLSAKGGPFPSNGTLAAAVMRLPDADLESTAALETLFDLADRFGVTPNSYFINVAAAQVGRRGGPEAIGYVLDAASELRVKLLPELPYYVRRRDFDKEDEERLVSAAQELTSVAAFDMRAAIDVLFSRSRPRATLRSRRRAENLYQERRLADEVEERIEGFAHEQFDLEEDVKEPTRPRQRERQLTADDFHRGGALRGGLGDADGAPGAGGS